MKKILLASLCILSINVLAQVPSGYLNQRLRFKWIGGIFDSSLHVPLYNGAPVGVRGGAWSKGGMVGVDTTNNKLYFYSGGSWREAGSSGWSLTGNAGTNTSTNFIGTTDAQPLMFRYNNLNAGSIGKSSGGTYLGIGAGENDNAEDEPNVGVGYYALYYNTTGSANSAVGASALSSNTTGAYNSVVGIAALASNTTGYNNSAVGASAGNNAKQKPDAKYQTLLGSSTYGTRDSITVLGASFIKETIVRGKLIDSTLSAGSGTKAVRWNSSTGEFTYADTTVGGGGLTIGTTTIANSATGSILYDSSGILSRNADLYWDVSNKRLGIGTTSPDSTLTVIGGLRINNGAAQNNYVWTSTGTDGRGTWKAAAGGATPAGSNKQVQYNNSGSFGGAAGVEIGNTNERLTVTSQSTSESAIVAKNEGGSGHVGISIENSNTNNPYSPLLTFTSNTTSNTRTSKIGLDYGKLMIEGSAEPYQTTGYSLVRFGNFYSGIGNVDIHNYVYATPSSPNNWTMKVRTPSTSSSGLAIEWGATGQTANLLELRNNSSTILSSFDKDGKLYLGSSSAPTTTLQVSGNMAANQGADVASANNLAVVANTTEITGTTQVNLIANTGWVNGAEINLLLANGITIKNGQTTSGSNITILLDGAADFVTASASMLTLVLSEVGGTQAWREKSRRSY